MRLVLMMVAAAVAVAQELLAAQVDMKDMIIIGVVNLVMVDVLRLIQIIVVLLPIQEQDILEMDLE